VKICREARREHRDKIRQLCRGFHPPFPNGVEAFKDFESQIPNEDMESGSQDHSHDCRAFSFIADCKIVDRFRMGLQPPELHSKVQTWSSITELTVCGVLLAPVLVILR
jgi:hypothetical protein